MTNEAAWLARYSTAAATSSGLPIRPSGRLAASLRNASSGSPSCFASSRS
ncbi:MAG: hypothetical protein QMD04_10025 [Anaerolineales bacterium]|nr:hypothetical protein [Anaerolineales bacterium]